jgi:glutathione peroxidase-family protein
MESSFFKYTVKDSNGQNYNLDQHKNHVVLVVNVASKCGFTPQYKDLETLHQKYKGKGLVILGFPCNQFGGQEPGKDEDIQQFCSLNYDVTFPVLSKVEVNGANEAPLYTFLKKSAPGFLGFKAIKWNFTKFLINKDGKVIHRFSPMTKPLDIEDIIISVL